MKKLNLIYIGIAWFLAAQAWGGNLTVDGNLSVTDSVNVASNVTSKTIRVGSSGTFSVGQYDPNTTAYGVAIHKGLNPPYLSTIFYSSTAVGLQTYSDTSRTPGQLGLNPYSGQVSIGTFDTIDEYGTFSSGLTVGPNAKFESDVEIDGKLNLYGGMDPPYVLLDTETRSNIANRVAREVPPSKQTGAALFWNSQTKQVEIYVAGEGAYYDLSGHLLASITAPIADTPVTRSYRIDPATGTVVSRESVHAPRWQLKRGYRFDTLTGAFTQMGSDSDVPPVTVPPQEALELK